MPSLWSGSITFGLVSIPVRVETSQRRRDLSFNFLHKACKQRVNQKDFCPVCEEYLTRDDLIRGYEYEKGSYVVLEREDFEKAKGEASRNIEIVAFVEKSRLQPSFLNRTYYLLPQEGAEKGYLLLLKAMSQTDRVAITRSVMRGKEYIAAVSFADRGLLLHTLFHKGEFKRMEETFDGPEMELTDKELTLATQIIDNLTEDFDEEMLVNQHRERLLQIIRQKIEGQEVTLAEPKKPAQVVDLMEALKKSLDATTKKKPAARIDASATPLEQRRRKQA